MTKATAAERAAIYQELFDQYHNDDYPQLRRATAKRYGLSMDGIDNAIITGYDDLRKYEEGWEDFSPAKFRKKLDYYIRRATYYYANQGLAFSVTKHFNNVPLPENERFEAAQAGFMAALETFDPSKGVQFSTYAWRIMSNEIIGANKKFRKPTLVKQKPREILANEDGFILEIRKSENTRTVVFHGEKIHPQDVVVLFNNGNSEKIYPYLYDLSADIKAGAQVTKGQRLGMTAGVETNVASIESILADEDHTDTEFINPLKKGQEEPDAQESVNRKFVVQKIYQIINTLPKNEQFIITKRFLGDKRENRKQVAREMNLSDYRVLKMEKHALGVLRSELEKADIHTASFG